jgi:putative nucleotidyltransferase with HDIG domain
VYKTLPGAAVYTFEYRLWFPVIFLSILALIFYSNVLFKLYQCRNSEDEKRLEKEIKKVKRKNENMVLQAVTGISELLDAKDPLTAEHSERVAEYAGLIAKRSGIVSEREINAIVRAGRLHDIGKMAIPDEILTKKGRLTDQEYETMKMHTIWGREILKNLTFIPEAQEVAGDHHERVDGTGYPKGLAGDEIPKYARIVSVADSLDAMNSNRCYRNCCAKDYIISQFKEGRGKQFDAHLADIVCELIEDGTIPISSLREKSEIPEKLKRKESTKEEVS